MRLLAIAPDRRADRRQRGGDRRGVRRAGPAAARAAVRGWCGCCWLPHQVLLTILAATAGIMAVLLLGTPGGPAVTATVSLYQLLGYNLLVVAPSWPCGCWS
jgi:hypothetical protein